MKEPMVIGHECAGVIEEVGSEVKSLVPGDRVALEPGISCWRCDLCKNGRYNLCPEMKLFATPPVHGSLANQVINLIHVIFPSIELMTVLLWQIHQIQEHFGTHERIIDVMVMLLLVLLLFA